MHAILKRTTGSLLFALIVIGLTFSYAIIDAILPDIIPNRLLARMSLWTSLVMTSYSAYTWVTIHKPVPPSVLWKFHSKWSVLIPIIVIFLIVLATLFPSSKHDRFDMFYIVLIAVIGEETLFRGLLWDLMNGYTGNIDFLHLPGTIWLTGLAFGVMHIQYHSFQINLASIIQIIYSFVMGLIFGAIRQRTESIVPSIFAHSAFNSLFNLMLTTVR